MENITNDRKKKIIIENANILNYEIKLIILNLIMMEVGNSIIMMSNNKKNIDINLDLLELKNDKILNHIYNIIIKKIDSLNKPHKSY